MTPNPKPAPESREQHLCPRSASCPTPAACDFHEDCLIDADSRTTIASLTSELATVKKRLESAERERGYAVRWANQSVEMLQASFFPLADALRALEAYLRNTPHHNAIEAAAARKALAVFDAAEVPALQEQEKQNG